MRGNSVVDVAEIAIGTQQAVQQQLGNLTERIAELGRNVSRREPADDPDMRLALLSDSFYRFANNSRQQLRQGFTVSGEYVIRPELGRARLVSVYCDMATHEDFFRDWNDYQRGFGNRSAEFWLGNELIHQLTRDRRVTLRLDMSDLDGERRYAEYAGFAVAPGSDQYRLTVGAYTGTAGDGLSSANGVGFTTRDTDNDLYGAGNCAELYKGGWWYDACHNGNPNGLYLRGPHGSYADGIDWRFWRGFHYSLATMEIKIRPTGFRPTQLR
ncbi:techylectin-5B-like [Pollicipes pollicipes]|uniref:techylectin-5B-like n=1 Tax=Pollicipes pollicipes TaxID=41117 RepID=UPI0018850F70|nr:techylectin-5B-like [Pollicipes pollicipes]